MVVVSDEHLGTHWFECDVEPRRHFTGDFREDRDAFDFALGLAVALNGSVHVRVGLDAGSTSAWRGLGWANPDGTIRWNGEGSPPLASALREFKWPGEEAVLTRARPPGEDK